MNRFWAFWDYFQSKKYVKTNCGVHLRRPWLRKRHPKWAIAWPTQLCASISRGFTSNRKKEQRFSRWSSDWEVYCVGKNCSQPNYGQTTWKCYDKREGKEQIFDRRISKKSRKPSELVVNHGLKSRHSFHCIPELPRRNNASTLDKTRRNKRPKWR